MTPHAKHWQRSITKIYRIWRNLKQFYIESRFTSPLNYPIRYKFCLEIINTFLVKYFNILCGFEGSHWVNSKESLSGIPLLKHLTFYILLYVIFGCLDNSPPPTMPVYCICLFVCLFSVELDIYVLGNGSGSKAAALPLRHQLTCKYNLFC